MPGHQRVERICERSVCGRRFLARAADVRRGQGRFCSRHCQCADNGRRSLIGRDQRGAANPNFKGWASRNKRAYVERFRARNPLKAAAHDAVRAAIQSGRLVRPKACERCGATPLRPLDSHHHDYSKPLDVEFVCRRCHRVADEERRATESKQSAA